MSYRMIGQDAKIQITLGQSALGAPAPSYGSAQYLANGPVAGIAKTVKISQDLKTVPMDSPGDTQDVFRSKRVGGTIRIEKFVASDGLMAPAKIGSYAKLEFVELSTSSLRTPYEGVISHWGWNFGDDDQVEEIEILLYAEHA